MFFVAQEYISNRFRKLNNYFLSWSLNRFYHYVERKYDKEVKERRRIAKQEGERSRDRAIKKFLGKRA